MTEEEEKKAIEVLKEEIKSLEKAKIEFSNEIEDKGWLQKNINELDKDIFYKNTLLNLIEKLKKERDIYYYEWKTLEADLINKNLIPKGKIREKIEELENEREQLRIDKGVTYDSGIYKISLIIETYKELLEEE